MTRRSRFCVLVTALAVSVLPGIVAAQPAGAATGGGAATGWAQTAGTKAKPARWNPCVPILYYVNPSSMPATGLADLREALRRVSAASGLTFKYAGTQRTIPTPGYIGPDNGFLVSWSTTARTKGALPPDAQGVAWMRFRPTGGVYKIMRGYLIISTDAIRGLHQRSGFGPGVPQGLILMHELAHLVGLDHVRDAWQIMNPGETRNTSSAFGAGDRAGLRAVGKSAGCL